MVGATPPMKATLASLGAAFPLRTVRCFGDSRAARLIAGNLRSRLPSIVGCAGSLRYNFRSVCRDRQVLVKAVLERQR